MGGASLTSLNSLHRALKTSYLMNNSILQNLYYQFFALLKSFFGVSLQSKFLAQDLNISKDGDAFTFSLLTVPHVSLLGRIKALDLGQPLCDCSHILDLKDSL